MHVKLMGILCLFVVMWLLCMLPTDEGAVKRPFIDPFVFVHLVCVGCRMQRMWEQECGGLLSLF